MAVTHLLYLHGFRSSPQSNKARQVAARVAQQPPAGDMVVPATAAFAAAAMELVMKALRHGRGRMAVMGSSLGGSTPPAWPKRPVARPFFSIPASTRRAT